MISNPLNDSFFFPSEKSPHEATILMLPYRCDTWNNGGYDAREVFYTMAQIVVKYEHLYLAVDPSIYDLEYERFSKLDNISIIKVHYNDSWARDIMPSIVTNGIENRIVDFRFNAWGGCVDGLYDDYSADDLVKKFMAKWLNYEIYPINDFVLEGGSFHVDDYGTLLTTEACLLSKGRNPSYTKDEIVAMLKNYLGVKKVVFIPHGIVNDETNEHVDNVACFTPNNEVLLAYSDEKEQKIYSEMAIKALEKETNALGEPFKIIKMPTPLIYSKEKDVKNITINDNAKKRLANIRLAASYINYYVGNGFVLFPQYGVKEDIKALELIKKIYNGYDVYPIMSFEILIGGGNIHCVTQQVPRRK